MGTEYYIACKKCGIKRGLDKLSVAVVADREQAMEFSEVVECSPYRAALLVSFMFEHRGHECVLLNDFEHDVFSIHDEPRDFWTPIAIDATEEEHRIDP